MQRHALVMLDPTYGDFCAAQAVQAYRDEKQPAQLEPVAAASIYSKT